MDGIELTNIKMVDVSDQKPTSDQSASVRMTGASNPAYVPADREEHGNKDVSLLLGFYLQHRCQSKVLRLFGGILFISLNFLII